MLLRKRIIGKIDRFRICRINLMLDISGLSEIVWQFLAEQTSISFHDRLITNVDNFRKFRMIFLLFLISEKIQLCSLGMVSNCFLGHPETTQLKKDPMSVENAFVSDNVVSNHFR